MFYGQKLTRSMKTRQRKNDKLLYLPSQWHSEKQLLGYKRLNHEVKITPYNALKRITHKINCKTNILYIYIYNFFQFSIALPLRSILVRRDLAVCGEWCLSLVAIEQKHRVVSALVGRATQSN